MTIPIPTQSRSRAVSAPATPVSSADISSHTTAVHSRNESITSLSRYNANTDLSSLVSLVAAARPGTCIHINVNVSATSASDNDNTLPDDIHTLNINEIRSILVSQGYNCDEGAGTKTQKVSALAREWREFRDWWKDFAEWWRGVILEIFSTCIILAGVAIVVGVGYCAICFAAVWLERTCSIERFSSTSK